MHPVVTLWRCEISENVTAVVEVMESRPGLLPFCTEALIDEKLGERKQLIIMFPGNPGVVNFYKAFVEQLASHGVDVLLMGFAGHSLHELNDHRYYVLQQQLEVAEAFCKTVLNAVTIQQCASVNVAGHSIGAYVALHMTARFPCINRAMLLTPTICNMRVSPNGKAKSHLLKKPLIMALCATALPLIHSLPEGIKDSLVALAQDGLQDHHRWVAKKMARPGMIRNLLMLARSEFEQVAALDVPLLQLTEAKLVFYFVKKDGWVPMEDYELIKRHVPRAVAVILEDDESVAHAWCLRHNEEVVQRGILPYL